VVRWRKNEDGGGSPGKHQEPPLVLYNRSRQPHMLVRDAMQVKALRALRDGPSNRHARRVQKQLQATAIG